MRIGQHRKQDICEGIVFLFVTCYLKQEHIFEEGQQSSSVLMIVMAIKGIFDVVVVLVIRELYL